MAHKRSFFERLTGSIRMDSDDTDTFMTHESDEFNDPYDNEMPLDAPMDDSDGELAVDVYRTNNAIIVKCMTAGVRKGDLDISITRETVTIQGRRETDSMVMDDQYYHRELYWGSFSRLIELPEEVEVEEAEAEEVHGLLTITLPLLDKFKEAKLKVK